MRRLWDDRAMTGVDVDQPGGPHPAEREPGGRRLHSQRVYDRLRRDISGRRLLPGTVLNESVISERYEVSRTPLREALLRLRQEGFLEKAGRQLRVKAFSFAEVEELYQVREALEKMAVRLCIERASDAEIAALGRHIDRYAEFDPVADYEALNEHANAFHRTIARLSGNAMLLEQLRSIHDKVLVINERFWTGREHSLEAALQEDRFIYRAIRERDITVAEAAIRATIQGVVALYRRGNVYPGAEEAG